MTTKLERVMYYEQGNPNPMALTPGGAIFFGDKGPEMTNDLSAILCGKEVTILRAMAPAQIPVKAFAKPRVVLTAAAQAERAAKSLRCNLAHVKNAGTKLFNIMRFMMKTNRAVTGAEIFAGMTAEGICEYTRWKDICYLLGHARSAGSTWIVADRTARSGQDGSTSWKVTKDGMAMLAKGDVG